MPRFEDPDDYEARQREFEGAGDDFFVSREGWYEERDEEPGSYSDEVRPPRGISRGGLTYGAFELAGSARCAACGSELVAPQRVIGRKEDGRWTILHYAEAECRAPTRLPDAAVPPQSLVAKAPPPAASPLVTTVGTGPLGRPCGACGTVMDGSEALRFDHTLKSFIHKSCLTPS